MCERFGHENGASFYLAFDLFLLSVGGTDVLMYWGVYDFLWHSAQRADPSKGLARALACRAIITGFFLAVGLRCWRALTSAPGNIHTGHHSVRPAVRTSFNRT